MQTFFNNTDGAFAIFILDKSLTSLYENVFHFYQVPFFSEALICNRFILASEKFRDVKHELIKHFTKIQPNNKLMFKPKHFIISTSHNMSNKINDNTLISTILQQCTTFSIYMELYWKLEFYPLTYEIYSDAINSISFDNFINVLSSRLHEKIDIILKLKKENIELYKLIFKTFGICVPNEQLSLNMRISKTKSQILTLKNALFLSFNKPKNSKEYIFSNSHYFEIQNDKHVNILNNNSLMSYIKQKEKSKKITFYWQLNYYPKLYKILFK